MSGESSLRNKTERVINFMWELKKNYILKAQRQKHMINTVLNKARSTRSVQPVTE